MNTEVYKFRIGNLDCMAVSDGNHTYNPPMFPPPIPFLFSNAPRESTEEVLLSHGIQPDEWPAWESPFISLLINTGDHLVLADTGAANIGTETGRLLQNLKAGGISPDDIDTVILTHGHPDHIAGTVDEQGRLVFPKARYVMWQDEWPG